MNPASPLGTPTLRVTRGRLRAERALVVRTCLNAGITPTILGRALQLPPATVLAIARGEEAPEGPDHAPIQADRYARPGAG